MEHKKEIYKLVEKIMNGENRWTREELQLYDTYSTIIEKLLKQKIADYIK
jgi:hypothetical protein